MAHAYYHAKSSARKFGGVTEDYVEVHEFMDHTKMHLADCRHRLFLHNTWGIFLVEKIFGLTLTRSSDEKVVALRPVLEQHVTEDFSFIPTLEECLQALPRLPLHLSDDDDMLHSYLSAISFGGLWSDYLPVHQLLNAAREVLADERSLRVLHNTWGITIIMRILGTTYVRPSDGISLSLRPILELHITKDMGHIPTLQECVEGIAIAPWMYRKAYPLSRLQDQSKVSA